MRKVFLCVLLWALSATPVSGSEEVAAYEGVSDLDGASCALRITKESEAKGGLYVVRYTGPTSGKGGARGEITVYTKTKQRTFLGDVLYEDESSDGEFLERIKLIAKDGKIIAAEAEEYTGEKIKKGRCKDLKPSVLADIRKKVDQTLQAPARDDSPQAVTRSLKPGDEPAAAPQARAQEPALGMGADTAK